MKAPVEENCSISSTTNGSNSSSTATCSFIKTSLSMTSLPPDEPQDTSEVIKAKLRMERPYNSLKKKRNPERELWRHSWGSNNSHSSCSLVGVSLRSGKDDFWAALQTNYNYIMDTNLLDTCREARGEIEGASSVHANTQDCYNQMLGQSTRNEGSAEDPRELRKWLRDMENKLSNVPSLSEATQMSIAELQRRLTEHSVLYCEIVSHARVVGACVRASERENNVHSISSEEKTPSPNGGSGTNNSGKKSSSDGNLKGLERRYHLLYLKAIEVQCLFEGLLGKKNSSSVLSRASSTETDDEPASKLARLSDSETKTHTSVNVLDGDDPLSCGEHTTISDENKSEGENEEDDGEDWPDLAADFNQSILNLQQKQLQEINVDFDADSEGSDCELLIKTPTTTTTTAKELNHYHHHHHHHHHNSYHHYHHHNNQRYYHHHGSSSGGKKDKLTTAQRFNKFNKNDSILSENMDSNLCETVNSSSLDYSNKTIVAVVATDKKLQKNLKNHNLNRISCSGSGNSSTSSATAVTTTTVGVSPTASSVKKRQRAVDISKFNRSNRKSKNCAIFYFKHLDTDNENFGLSSQGSDVHKSGEPSSEDEGWLFSNNGIDGQNILNDDSDKENKKAGINISEIHANQSINSNTITIVESHNNNSNNNSSSKESMNSFDTSSILNGCGGTANEERERSMRTDLSHLKGEIHMEIINNNNNNNMTENNTESNTESSSDVVTCKGVAVANTCEKNKNLSEIKTTKMIEISHKECSNESIKQLVINAENLIREEALLKTPTKKKHSTIKMSSSTTSKKREINLPGPNIQRVQEWLEHQPISPKELNHHTGGGTSLTATDCEASGEYTESDSGGARESDDTSEGLTDSIATCMQTGSTSTEIIGGSAEPIMNVAGSNPNLSGAKVIRRGNRRNSDRPWSVSCLSQLTENDTINSDKVNSNQGLASHSISESALHILSSPRRNKQSSQVSSVKKSESKNSLKRRRTRRRKLTGRKSDSGSDGILPYDLPRLTQSLIKSESLSGQINIIQDLTMALSMISVSKTKKSEEKANQEFESEEEQALMKPNFKLGSYTSAYMTNESKLGSLAALANYMNEDQGEYNTGTEDHSSFSEQAWDNYQEKYLSENYSEGLDSDAARRLLEFGDDYRNFLDSQSDCCSSLSAANNIDSSLSPPRMDSLKQIETKITQQTLTSTVDHARRRRALELEYERRRKTAEMKKRSSQDEINNVRSPTTSCSSNSYLSPKSGDKTQIRIADASKKLDFGMYNSAQSLRKTSESDTSCRRRKSEEMLTNRRRSSRTLEKSFKAIQSSSSSNDDSDDEKELKNLLTQSKNRLENTKALKIKSHLLRPEDYSEIITICRDNIRCLDSVLRGPPGTVLSTARTNEMKDLLSSWENLLSWSENAGAARQMQEDMVILKNALNRLGKQTCDFDSESSIQFVIEELKNEKTQLQTYRTNMLRLNASVHSWLTRQEMKLKKELEALAAINEAENNINNNNNNNNNSNDNNNNNDNNNSQEKGSQSQISSIVQSESEFHKHLKDEVSEMYSAWDEADARINTHLEALTASLIAWRQLECGLSEFHQVLEKDRGTLKGLEGALNKGRTTSIELAQNVKLVAKLLSEKVDLGQQQVAIATDETIDANRIVHIAQFTSSNGSLSDSGISDGGATSDGGLSERERRLGVLRRLAKQLENALAPNSDALKSISARMESAEAELKTLQNTCRELIVRTAVSQHKSQAALLSYATAGSGGDGVGGKSQQRLLLKKSPTVKRKNKRKSLTGPVTGTLVKNNNSNKKYNGKSHHVHIIDSGSGDPEDPQDDPWVLCTADGGDSDPKGGWAWRVAKIALPVQIALLTLFCAACLMEPHCCDSLNNLSMSFTPQLRYIRGPPPI